MYLPAYFHTANKSIGSSGDLQLLVDNVSSRGVLIDYSLVLGSVGVYLCCGTTVATVTSSTS